MFVELLKSKIHRATVTAADLNYEGSITVDRDLMDAANLVPYEKVHVFNINNGARAITYVIEGKRGSGEICSNGALARLVEKGDLIIIAAFAQMETAKALSFKPSVVHVDDKNKVK
ncbi:MAG: aspartate 1-decarboxylase [Calditrichaeota bacterium]|nr:aspartate 1-decarboxylase [Calditrichota bacterium]